MESVIDLINNLIKFGDKNISYVIDIDENIWFRFQDIAQILKLKEPKKSLKLIDTDDKKYYQDLVIYKRTTQRAKTVYLTESGIYSFLLRSTMPIAKTFQKWLTKDVLPQLRKQGIYELNKKLKEELKDLQKQLKATQKELDKFIKQHRREPYPKGAHVYIIDLDDGKVTGKKVYKIGKALDLEERLAQYNVGRDVPIDFTAVFKTDNALCVEGCVRSMLGEYKYANSRDKFICDLELIKNAIEACVIADKKCHKLCKKEDLDIETTNVISDTILDINNKINHINLFIK